MRYMLTTTDKEEAELALKAREYYLVCFDIDQEMRMMAKHGGDTYSDETIIVIDKLRDRLRESMEDYGILEHFNG